MKKGLNGKHSAPTATNQTHSRRQATAAALVAEAKKKVSLGSKLHKKTRKKLSREQADEARDTLDAEFRGLRAGVSTKYTLNRHPSRCPFLLHCSVSVLNCVVCAYIGGLIYPFFFTAYARFGLAARR
jgi:hypothetical protein